LVLLFIILFFATFLQFRGLAKYYQTLQPVPGGLYNEGIIGTFTNANPIYAAGAADTAVSRLVFSGLFKYNNKNQLAGDLAENWNLGSDNKQYIVHLRKNVKWQDGRPFTADDVVFTYKLSKISKPNPRSIAAGRGLRSIN
jgi:peptide/nickel transport system substrate-binding protein